MSVPVLDYLPKQRLTASLLCAVVLAATSFVMPVAHASDEDSGVLATIEAFASKQVLQDEVQVTLSTQAKGANAPEVNRQLAAALDKARQGFEVPKDVKVSAGPFRVYLDYGKDNKPQGWVGRASLQLRSTNLDKASTAIEHFGKTLAVSSLRFSLSSQARQDHERQLMDSLAKDFDARASAAAQAFGLQGYELLSLDFTGGQNFSPRAVAQRAEAAPMVGAAGPRISLEPGMTTVQISVTGQVRMH